MALWDFFAKQDYHALRHYRFFSFQLAETKVTVTYANVTTPAVAGSPYTFLTETDFTGGTLTPLITGSPQITVTPKPLTISGGFVPANKVYDGTDVASLAIGAPTLAGKVGLDVVTLNAGAAVGTFSDKHIGVGKTVAITGLSLSGADAGNYIIATTTRTANITKLLITVTAVTQTRNYDGTANSSGVPNLSLVLPGTDTSGFTQTFNNKHVGTGKTLTPTGAVNDGNSGLDYSYTFIANTTGVVNQLPITVTAATDAKTYDKSISSSVAPTLSPGLPGTDTSGFTQTFDNINVGAGNKTLTPTGKVNDGNSGNNYSYAYTPVSNGTINPKPITVTADAQSKTYGAPDPALTYTVIGLISGDPLSGGLTRAAGNDVGSYAISQGALNNSNYSITIYTGANLTVNKDPLTVKPNNFTILSGALDPVVFTFYYVGFVSPDGVAPVDASAVIDVAPTCSSSGVHIIPKAYPIACSGGSDNNYAFSFVNGALTVVLRNTYDSVAANDGWALESSEFSNQGNMMNATSVLRVGDDSANKQYRSLLYFDTSRLPDNAIISKATVKINKAGVTGTDPFTTHGALIADMAKGFFGLSSLETTDFQAPGALIPNAGSFVATILPTYQLTLNPVNFKYVNPFGATQFRLRFTWDDNNNKVMDFVSFYGGDALTATDRPQLTIEYYTP